MVTLFTAAILLLTSFDITLCQRKVSRNVAVGGEVKTVVNFNCPEEFGYYPHPSDCTQYYVCVFGGALLESCTGGLMYSHELQTCDWPRNVGCDGAELSGPGPISATSPNPQSRTREEPRTRYAPPTPPPAQPAAIVTSRGQPRQLHHNQQEIIKQRQQQQLYADAEETLPPAEEIESDRQQRVYRGQPSTVGQVQRDRDGLRHSNAIPNYSGRGEKIGVISFGTQQQQYRVEQSSAAPVQPPISTVTATARTLYNSSQYNNNYDPYYALYDDDVELYRDVDYSQHYNNNNNNNAAQSQTPQQSYRRTPSPVVQTTQEEAPKRGNSAYIQNSYSGQDIYQPSTSSDYNEDNSYNSQVDDQNAYRQINRQPTRYNLRGDRNDLNYFEEATTKRTTTTTTTRKTTTTTRTTTARTFPPKKSTVPSRLPVTANENKTQAQSLINTLREDPGPHPLTPNTIDFQSNSSLRLDETTTTIRPKLPDTSPKVLSEAVIHKPVPFVVPRHLTTEKSIVVFHYITKSSRSTSLVSTDLPPTETSAIENSPHKNKTVIVPTTYSPPKFFLKSLLPKPVTYSTTVPNLSESKPENKPHKTLKSVRKLISPINVNYGLSVVTGSSFESAEKLVSEVDSVRNILPYRRSHAAKSRPSDYFDESTTKTTKPSTLEHLTSSSESITHIVPGVKDSSDELIDDDYTSREETKLRHYVEPYTDSYNVSSEAKRFRTTIEIPPPHDLIDDYQKLEPDQSPDYKLQPFPKPIALTTTTTKTTTTDSPHNTSIPARVSRVNTAIKSLIAFGGTRRQNVKCHENQSADSKCNDPKHQRTSTRGRGSTHYVNGGNVVNNEVTVTVNRGTPASRPRPTLKPSTSIVSKASEFIDIYRYPPTRPEPIYPQPQPDKTAAKCRKDVCLLPDCYCGGKEIPGNLPVEEVPQIVLLTFDDAVNDLNKQYYIELFESGRLNPNGCPISATFYVSHEWTDYSQVQNLYADGHEMASHTVSHSFGEQFSQKKWTREVAGQREILSAYGGVHLEDVRGMRAPFLSVGGNKMFKMLYDSNFTYDSSMPIYENKPPSWPYTLDYKLFHDCMIPPCPTRSYPGVWEVPMVMWQDLNGGRCSMGDACSNPPDAEGVFKMLTKNFQRHYTTNRAPFGLFYHAAWFTQPHHKEGFINFLDSILAMKDVWLLTNWQAIQWVRDPTPVSRLGSFQPFQCDFSNRPKRCNNPKVCNLWHKSGVRYMRTCQPCPDIYPWTGNTGIRSSRIDNDIED
ncbi:mucin-4 isoform X2 [Tenebrio molitor]|uniref:mucin-4 isoform X2 n=1 Tax=Tenebrio molitor TaxID=7067 RepID=UPI0036248D99